MKRLLAFTVGLFAVVGCHSAGTDVDSFDKIKIERNVTTEADLRKELGSPQSTGERGDGSKTLVWSGAAFHGFGGWGHHESRSLHVTIRDGKVVDYQKTEHGKD